MACEDDFYCNADGDCVPPCTGVECPEGWGCLDGEHKAWLIAELDSKGDARRIVPPAYRYDAKIVELSKFSLREAEEMLHAHNGEQSAQEPSSAAFPSAD